MPLKDDGGVAATTAAVQVQVAAVPHPCGLCASTAPVSPQQSEESRKRLTGQQARRGSKTNAQGGKAVPSRTASRRTSSAEPRATSTQRPRQGSSSVAAPSVAGADSWVRSRRSQLAQKATPGIAALAKAQAKGGTSRSAVKATNNHGIADRDAKAPISIDALRRFLGTDGLHAQPAEAPRRPPGGTSPGRGHKRH